MVDFLRGLPFLLRSREKKNWHGKRDREGDPLFDFQSYRGSKFTDRNCSYMTSWILRFRSCANSDGLWFVQQQKAFAWHETASRRTGYLRGSPPPVPPAGAAFPPPIIVAVVRWCLHRLRPHHRLHATTATPQLPLTPDAALEPGAHTLAFDTSVTLLVLAVIHAPVAAKSTCQAGWIS